MGEGTTYKEVNLRQSPMAILWVSARLVSAKRKGESMKMVTLDVMKELKVCRRSAEYWMAKALKFMGFAKVRPLDKILRRSCG